MAAAVTAYTKIDSPLGPVLIVGTERGLSHISFQKCSQPLAIDSAWQKGAPFLEDAARQLTEYFAGKRRTFELRLDPAGTEFQKKVWAALCEVPYGKTATYGEIAKAIGAPTASRAVGAANGANPLPIVVPCHRVIGSTGALTGYAGGLKFKRGLLEIEGWHFGSEQLRLVG